MKHNSFFLQDKLVDHCMWAKCLSVRTRRNTDYQYEFDDVCPFVVQSEQYDGGIIFNTIEFGFNTLEEVRAFAQKILDCGGPPLIGLYGLERQKVFPAPQTLDEWILANWPPQTLELMKTPEWAIANPTEQRHMIEAMLGKLKLPVRTLDIVRMVRFVWHSKNNIELK
jgi:hypothetical protein